MTITMYEGRKNVSLEEVEKLDQNLQETNEELKKINNKKWHEKWWGILILGIIASAIVAGVVFVVQALI